MYRYHIKWRSMQGVIPFQVCVSVGLCMWQYIVFGYLTTKSLPKHTHSHTCIDQTSYIVLNFMRPIQTETDRNVSRNFGGNPNSDSKIYMKADSGRGCITTVVHLLVRLKSKYIIFQAGLIIFSFFRFPISLPRGYLKRGRSL